MNSVKEKTGSLALDGRIENKLNKLFINGEWVSSENNEFRDIINPFTGESVAQVVRGNEADVDKAVKAAKEAFATWSVTPLDERLAYLEKFYSKYRENEQIIAETMSMEMGAPIPLSKQFLTKEVGDIVRNAIDVARYYPHEEKIGNALIIKEAYGVMGAITPWNNPALFFVIKNVVAIAGGCTVVHKPAEMTPLNTYLLAVLLEECDLPGGVYNLVTGQGRVVGEAIVKHPDVDLISLTGSTTAGRRIAELCAQVPKKAILELGGKSACVVLDDADMDEVPQKAINAIMSNSGQLCAAWSRLVVPRKHIEEITAKLVNIVQNMKMGDPLDPSTELGPMVSAHQQQTVREYIEIGIREGATLATGGSEQPEDLPNGSFVKPTIFTNVDNTMRIAQEEIFGPVLVVIPHDGDEDAIRIANESEYGLHGGVLSGDKDRAIGVARKIRTGQIDTRGFLFDVQAPFGGYKHSGYGRCMGTHGYEEYLQTKAIMA